MFQLGGAGLGAHTCASRMCVAVPAGASQQRWGRGSRWHHGGEPGPGWGSRGVDNEQMNFCLPPPVVPGRDPRLSQPPIALPNCFCPHPLDRACSARFPCGEQGPLSFTRSLVCSSPAPVLLLHSEAQTPVPPRTTQRDLVLPLPHLTFPVEF